VTNIDSYIFSQAYGRSTNPPDGRAPTRKVVAALPASH